ncbi:NTP transferase domain-containing protein [Naasia sp. SYSU D00057]|uniref:nucleotidyltransferase family protein n=1 Tax=Naasia sp. SYSU D00057 TaxID=2817380 RepID=UPI001B316789|nr:NTP transferase domain-containing protein [Naasia sp. SYSU D00057]
MAERPLPGLILAAGGGLRYGGPKALARTAAGEPWLHRAADALSAGGAQPVLAVLGASAEEARALLPGGVSAVVAQDWADGIGASLAAGLAALEADHEDAAAAVVTLVDLPGLPPAAVRRVAAGALSPSVLRQAVYEGRPGHPVLLGRAHWAPLRAALTGDAGARQYLVANGVTEVECGDLWPGEDVDRR